MGHTLIGRSRSAMFTVPSLNFLPCLIRDLEIETFKLRYDLYRRTTEPGQDGNKYLCSPLKAEVPATRATKKAKTVFISLNALAEERSMQDENRGGLTLLAQAIMSLRGGVPVSIIPQLSYTIF